MLLGQLLSDPLGIISLGKGDIKEYGFKTTKFGKHAKYLNYYEIIFCSSIDTSTILILLLVNKFLHF